MNGFLIASVLHATLLAGLTEQYPSLTVGHKNGNRAKTLAKVPSYYTFAETGFKRKPPLEQLQRPKADSYLNGLFARCIQTFGTGRKECVAKFVRHINNADEFKGRHNVSVLRALLGVRKTAQSASNQPGTNRSRTLYAGNAPKPVTNRRRTLYAGNAPKPVTNTDSLICRTEEFGFPRDTQAGIVNMATSMMCALCQEQNDGDCVDRWCFIDTSETST